MDMQHPKSERTLFILKPDGVQRGLAGEIISRFERKGLKIVAMKMVDPTVAQLEDHYKTLDDAWAERIGGYIKEGNEAAGTPFKYASLMEAGYAVKKGTIEYLEIGPLLVMVLEGNNAVAGVRKLLGSTDPSKADIGTIRADFTVDSNSTANYFERSLRNIAHASGAIEEAEMEIKVWFQDSEIVSYETAIEKVLYDQEWGRKND